MRAANWFKLEARMMGEATVYPVAVPDGARGEWEVRTVEILPAHLVLNNLRHIRDGIPEAVVSPGSYKVLRHSGEGVVMSNTQLEYRTNRGFVERASGHVLITGLGLGMILRPLAARREVRSITVVEICADLIAMIAPHYRDVPNLTVIRADATAWSPPAGTKFDAIWHDIWPSFGSAYIRDHVRMRRLFAPHVAAGGFQECWAEELSRRMRRLER